MIIKKTFFIFTFLFLALFGTFTLVSAASSLLVSNGGSLKIGNDLLVLLLEIKSIELHGDIFEDKAFTNLKDFGVEIAPQPVGRDNPFSAI